MELSKEETMGYTDPQAFEALSKDCFNLQEEVKRLNLQIGALKAVAEAAKEALGCCDYGCDKLTGCDHKNCCSLDAKVIEALHAAGYTDKRA